MRKEGIRFTGEQVKSLLTYLTNSKIKIDRAQVTKYEQSLYSREKSLKMCLKEIGINDPTSRSDIYKKMGRGVSGGSLSKDILNSYEWGSKVVDYRHVRREISILNSIGIQLLQGEISGEHFLGNSGRIYTRNYNIHQLSKAVRGCLVPSNPSSRFILYDYSQADLRSAALMSGCQELIEDLNTWADLYKKIGDDFGYSDRNKVKVIFLALLYGADPDWLKRFGAGATSNGEIVGKMIKGIKTRYVSLFSWAEESGKKSEAVTLSGFRRDLSLEPDLKKRARMVINTTVQGTTADILTYAMIKLLEMGVKVVTGVYDSILVEIPAETLTLSGEIDSLVFPEIDGMKMKGTKTLGTNWGQCMGEVEWDTPNPEVF